MRREFIIILVLVWGASAQATIVDVTIEPEDPSITAPISIIVSGLEGSGPVEISNSDFHVDGTTLELDLFVRVGFFTVMTPWEHCEDIGILSLGAYNLEVNEIYVDYPGIVDTYATTFQVIPEPATIMLFGLGGIGLKRSLG